jgi:hypothetical protein
MDGFGQIGFYDVVEIFTGIQNPDEVWSIASQIAHQYGQAQFLDASAVPQYAVTSYNSNSYINCIFQAVGLDLESGLTTNR